MLSEGRRRGLCSPDERRGTRGPWSLGPAEAAQGLTRGAVLADVA